MKFIFLFFRDLIVPFEEDFTNVQIEGISETLEVALWQGDTTSLDPNLNKFDGLIKIIDNEATVIDADNVGIANAAVFPVPV